MLLAALLVLVGLALLAGGFMFWMPGRSHKGPLPDLTAAQRALQGELEVDLRRLALDIGERNVWEGRGLDRAEAFLTESLEAAGCAVERQVYRVRGREVANLIAEIPGGEDAREVVVVGGHYDTVSGCPGANDNGTGVVATLALARAFADSSPRRTLRFVLFVNEEPPFFQTDSMGSLVYAKACRERGDDVVAMLSLETIGYYSDDEDTQHYPFPIGLLYPSQGNFVAFVGNVGSRRLVRDAIRSFREHAAFPSEGAAVPGGITGVGWSDHWSFWQAGYPGVMVTDTAPFRYGHYHTAEDRVSEIRFEPFARVVDGLRHVVADLARMDLPERASSE